MKKKYLTFILLLIISSIFVTNRYALSSKSFRYIYKPIVVIKGQNIYNPIKFLKSKPVDRKSKSRYLSLLQALALVSAYICFIKKEKPNLYGDAKWADKKDVDGMNLNKKDGVILGMYKGKILSHSGPEHLMMMAPTRMGKGINTVLPTLWSWKKSVIVNDIKGECWELTAGYRKEKFGHKCMMFNPLDETGESVSYNPLDLIKLKTKSELEDVRLIVSTLIDTEGKGEGDHWISSAINLLIGCLLHVKYMNEKASLTDVVKFMTNPNLTLVNAMALTVGIDMSDPEEPEEVEPIAHTDDKDLFNRIYGEKGFGSGFTHPIIASIFSTMLETPDKERGSIISTCLNKLQIFKDPKIQMNTAKSDFNPKMIMQEKISLYLVTPPKSIDMTRPLLRLILTQTIFNLTDTMKFGNKKQSTVEKILKPFKEAKEKIKDLFIVKEEKNKILFLIDEFPSLGKLDLIEKAIAYIAGYGLKVLLITQSMNQLKKIYGDKNSVLDNCHVQIYLTPNDSETPKMISDMLGTTTKQAANESYKKFSLLKDVNISESQVSASLMTPGQVRTLPFEKVIIFVAGKVPIYADKIFYWKIRRFKNSKNYNIPKLNEVEEEIETNNIFSKIKKMLVSFFFIDVGKELLEGEEEIIVLIKSYVELDEEFLKELITEYRKQEIVGKIKEMDKDEFIENMRALNKEEIDIKLVYDVISSSKKINFVPIDDEIEDFEVLEENEENFDDFEIINED